MQHETGITDVVDPWGGSYLVERLTADLARRAWAHIEEIEALGGMTKALETGTPKMRIEEAAARRQAQIDSGWETIIGVNKYRPKDEKPIAHREVDNTAVRAAQIRRLAQLRAERDEAAAQAALGRLTDCARAGAGNLLALAVEAARARAPTARYRWRWSGSGGGTRRWCGRWRASTAGNSRTQARSWLCAR